MVPRAPSVVCEFIEDFVTLGLGSICQSHFKCVVFKSVLLVTERPLWKMYIYIYGGMISFNFSYVLPAIYLVPAFNILGAD